MSQPLMTLVDWKQYRFVIMDAPNDMNLHIYVDLLRKHGVTDVVRVCEEVTYPAAKVEEAGIKSHALPFRDGAAPPDEVLDRWLALVDSRFKSSDGKATIAVHCLAGLGRAPLLVAIALIEGGLEWEQAVEHIRSKRRGVINAKQLSYLQGYTRRTTSGGCGCVVM